MGLKGKLINKRVFIDTAPLIYFIEGHSTYQKELLEIFEAGDNGELNFLTSTLTLLEVLVQPLKLKRSDIAAKYEQILTTSPGIDLIEMDVEISKKAAQLRAAYNLKTPDSIQLATAMVNGASIFLTNDLALKRVTGIDVVLLSDN